MCVSFLLPCSPDVDPEVLSSANPDAFSGCQPKNKQANLYKQNLQNVYYSLLSCF